MKVYLDDVRPLDENHRPEDGWVRTTGATETITLLGTRTVTEISLDNDLGDPDSRNEGYRVLDWIEEQVMTTDFNPPEVMSVHSANPVRSQSMRDTIESIRRRVAERARRHADHVHFATLGDRCALCVPFSRRLLDRLTPVLRCELDLHGLEVNSVTMEPIEGDEILVDSTNMNVVLSVQATTAGCRP